MYEASPYASVYKFSHDIASAKAALGSGGCTDCHRAGSPFFHGAVLAKPFDPSDGRPRWMANYQILGVSLFWAKLGAFREELMKPMLYSLVGLLSLVVIALGVRWLAVSQGALGARAATVAAWAVVAAGVVTGLVSAATPGLLDYMTVRRFSLDANHFWIACAVFAAAIAVLLVKAGRPVRFPKAEHIANRIGWALVGLAGVSGALMVLKVGWLASVTRLAYTFFDINLVAAALVTTVLLGLDLALPPRGSETQ